MSWTQPICDPCWRLERPHDQPTRITPPESERCCLCGEQTASGIYVRRNPNAVPFPSTETGEQAL